MILHFFIFLRILVSADTTLLTIISALIQYINNAYSHTCIYIYDVSCYGYISFDFVFCLLSFSFVFFFFFPFSHINKLNKNI